MTFTLTPSRKVYIISTSACHFVKYLDREPRQRLYAAQFDARHKTREQVEQWVRHQDNLILTGGGGYP
jgi:hypothetical protein